jgi:hypothetical protein
MNYQFASTDGGSVTPDSSGTGGHGNHGAGSLANEGVGNGLDAPPPGQDYNFNDAAGAVPGQPGAQGGNGYDPHPVTAVEIIGAAFILDHVAG